ncbi:hypothetical protein [Roseivirga pacifica]|uniref:hypothetical protein n=1 Tax=Roseivirga pacifica TaxID=1267423 RepID=UPI003BAE1621
MKKKIKLLAITVFSILSLQQFSTASCPPFEDPGVHEHGDCLTEHFPYPLEDIKYCEKNMSDTEGDCGVPLVRG